MKPDHSRPIRVLLADDHHLFRLGVQAHLARQAHIRVVGEAATGEDAVRLACAMKPDIVLLDLDMPGSGGLAAAKELRKLVPDCRVIILSMHSDKEYARQAVAVGAKGYLQKDASPMEMRTAIETVYHGHTHFSTAASQSLLEEVVEAGGSMPNHGADGLTTRERQVLVLIAEGASNKDVARKLKIGVRTVETHRQRLRKKLGISTAVSLTKYALKHRLIKL